MAGSTVRTITSWILDRIEIKERLRKRLKDMRTAKGLSQELLADEIGVTRACYDAWEAGRNDIPLYGLVKLARYYGLSLDGLVFG